MILSIDVDLQRVSLGIKQVDNRYDAFAQRHAVGDRIIGRVREVDLRKRVGRESKLSQHATTIRFRDNEKEDLGVPARSLGRCPPAVADLLESGDKTSDPQVEALVC